MKEQLMYRKRVADGLLADKLEAMGAVLIEGPKACGKTTTAEQQANFCHLSWRMAKGVEQEEPEGCPWPGEGVLRGYYAF